MMLQRLRREDLEALTTEILRPALDARPEVRAVELDGAPLVVKDFAAGDNVFKRGLGAWLIRRELAAYRRLGGLRGIPRLWGMIGHSALVLERLDAVQAPYHVTPAEAPEFCERLRRLVDAIHDRGVVHGDLRNMANVLVDREGEPALVDFTASFVGGSGPVGALLLGAMADDDYRGVIKLKAHLAPDAVTAQERAFLEYRSPAEIGFRSWREHVRHAVQRWSR